MDRHNCYDGFWGDWLAKPGNLLDALDPENNVVPGSGPNMLCESTYASLIVLQREIERALGVAPTLSTGFPVWVGGGTGLTDANEAALRGLIHHFLGELASDQFDTSSGTSGHHVDCMPNWMLPSAELLPNNAQTALRGGSPPAIDPSKLLGRVRAALGST